MINRPVYSCHYSVSPCLRSVFFFTAVLAVAVATARGEDLIELQSGAKVRGQIKERTASSVTIDVVIGTKTLSRKYPTSSIAAITAGGKREELTAQPASAGASKTIKPTTKDAEPTAGGDGGKHTKVEIDALVDRLGRTPPDWFDATSLNYPQTLDLTWPKQPAGGWNNQKNVGQFMWDVVNPNPGRWRESVKLMHHLMTVNSTDRDVQQRAMDTLGRIYHNLLEDYARAAFWWRKAGVDQGGVGAHGVHLAECYWRLGSKQMAVDLLNKLPPQVAMIKLWADMGETAKALTLVDAVVRGGNPDVAYLDGGDACRTAGRYGQALDFYRKVLDVPATGQAKGRIERSHNRAKASIEAVTLFETLDLKRVSDGAYRASSLGYEGQVEVEAAVQSGRLVTVKVTQHKEKQFYSALTDTPRKIIAKQGVRGVDATSSATITSEAIINATAKSLAGAMK